MVNIEAVVRTYSERCLRALAGSESHGGTHDGCDAGLTPLWLCNAIFIK